ncbi:MAG: hypothetical protein P1Q69_04095 [Candidatus Thorarchaeota archaeon]|nr:hypothetical protein [Candidatus Thorarchaeota archaeon]
MDKSDCSKFEEAAEERAKGGHNEDAMEMFLATAKCWYKWEFFSKAANAYERAYEHAMLANQYSNAAEYMQDAGDCWIKEGEHEKFEIDYQIASEAHIYAAEEDRDPIKFVEGAFCAIIGGDLDLARHLIHAAAETTRGKAKELINLALMLNEYHFGDAHMYIEAALTRVSDKEGMKKIRELFLLIFAGFIRSLLESEIAVTISSLAESTGLSISEVNSFVKRGIERGHIPAYLDQETQELVVDSDRLDMAELSRRQGPIMSRDLEDPGAWDVDLDE